MPKGIRLSARMALKRVRLVRCGEEELYERRPLVKVLAVGCLSLVANCKSFGRVVCCVDARRPCELLKQDFHGCVDCGKEAFAGEYSVRSFDPGLMNRLEAIRRPTQEDMMAVRCFVSGCLGIFFKS